VSHLTRSGNGGLRQHERKVALQMKRNLDFRGFEPQRPSSPLFPHNPRDVVESAAFLISAVSQSLATCARGRHYPSARQGPLHAGRLVASRPSAGVSMTFAFTNFVFPSHFNWEE